ncbi:MAG TPA: hypothetical protein VJ501_11115, partial [Burkholderiaceae bacterium]|nr:hypothetical protein [Burkholderiaceae bacterium]
DSASATFTSDGKKLNAPVVPATAEVVIPNMDAMTAAAAMRLLILFLLEPVVPRGASDDTEKGKIPTHFPI